MATSWATDPDAHEDAGDDQAEEDQDSPDSAGEEQDESEETRPRHERSQEEHRINPRRRSRWRTAPTMEQGDEAELPEGEAPGAAARRPAFGRGPELCRVYD